MLTDSWEASPDGDKTDRALVTPLTIRHDACLLSKCEIPILLTRYTR